MQRQYWTVGFGILVTSYVILYVAKSRKQLSSKTRFDKEAEKASLPNIQKRSTPTNYVHQPIKIRKMTLRNRCIKSATFESASRNGRVTNKLIDFHKKQAQSAAMVTISYGCISPEGRTFPHQLLLLPENKEGLQKLCDRIHNETKSKISIQLTHAGLMAEPFDDEYTEKYNTKGVILSASATWSMSAFQFATKMNKECIRSKINQFSQSALLCKQCGFDAITLHCGHGYLISQFLSRTTNDRDDEYGASSLKNRCRFASEIVAEIRRLCGNDFPIFIKINSHDGVDSKYGGVTVDESIEFCKILIQNGADVIIPTAGVILKNGIFMMRGNVPIYRMATEAVSWIKRIGIGMFGPWIIENRKFRPMFLWETSLKLLNGLKDSEKKGEIRDSYFVCYLGGITSLDDMNKAFGSGFELVAMGRALLREPDFLDKISKDPCHVSLCDHENRCIIGQMSGKPLRCYAISNDIEDLK